jgi:hypothetical protein
MVRDEHGDGQRHGRIQPVPAAPYHNDRARHGHPGRGGGIRDGVEHDGRHRQVSLVAVVVPAQDQCRRRHHQRGDTARHQDGEAVHRGRAGGQPVDRRARHDELEHQQPPRVDQRGGTGRTQAPAAWPPGREADRQQGQARAGGIEEVVTALGQHPQRMRAGPYHGQAGDEGQVEHQDHRQALHPGHL